MKKLTAVLITSALLISFVPSVLAKPKGDWNAVKAAGASHAVAVETRSGKTHFGLIHSIDDSGFKMVLAARDDMTSQTINVQRDEVAKVWLARLRFDEDNMTKAGWIGAGVGTGVIFIVASQSSDPPHGAALFPMAGAAAGVILGRFWKKKHKKQALIYSL